MCTVLAALGFSLESKVDTDQRIYMTQSKIHDLLLGANEHQTSSAPVLKLNSPSRRCRIYVGNLSRLKLTRRKHKKQCAHVELYDFRSTLSLGARAE